MAVLLGNTSSNGATESVLLPTRYEVDHRLQHHPPRYQELRDGFLLTVRQHCFSKGYLS